ncbi:type II secretion system protein GspD, partial [bacterium]|nr:type II secretion system protein GspD [bacterium]
PADDVSAPVDDAPVSDGEFDGGSSPAGKSKAPSAPKASIPAKKVPRGQELVSIDFPEPTPIKDIIKAVSQWTGKNFILGQGVSSGAKVAIISPQQVTKEEAYQAFLSALNVAGYTTVDTGKAIKIVPTRQATASNIKTFYGASWAPMTDEIITQIIPLSYIDAQTVSNQLRTILRESNPVPFQTTNSLIVSDTGHKIRRLLEIIRLLDVKGNQPQVAILPIKNTDANDIGKKIQDVFGARGGGGALYLQKVIVDERTNSLILIGPPRGLDDVARLVARLDKPLDDGGTQAQIHVRPLDYADAEKLAGTLQSLAQGSASLRGRRSSSSSSPNGAGGQPGGGATADIGGVKITSDKATNALIIQGSKAAFNEVDSIIRQLDKRRDQVYVETDIIDVNLGNQMSLSTSFLAGATAANGKINAPLGWKPGGMAPFAITNPNASTSEQTDLLSKAIPSQALLGVLSSKKVKIGGIELSPGAFIFALKQDSNSNVLQTPSLLVADNEESNFEATERENILINQEDPTTKVRTQKIETLDATLGVKIKPQISKADFVSMDVQIKAESFGRRNSENRPEQTNKRSFNTKVTVQNEQTIVVSGLQRDLEIDGKDKVPLLGDIPIIGWLFRNSSTTKAKTTLMIFLTPHVVRSSEDLGRIYDKKVQARDEFLKAFYGSDFKKRDVFRRLRTLDEGKVPGKTKTAAAPDSAAAGAPAADSKAQAPAAPAVDTGKEGALPSNDSNPIIVPGASGGIGGGGDVGGSAPPPPPPGPSGE